MNRRIAAGIIVIFVLALTGSARADVGRPGITFALVKNGRSNIYIVSDGGARHLLVGGSANERAPAWSPDG
ncbi:MAG: hypothetical protein ABR579_05395, partial [Actinomycetota bacterium]